MRSVHSAMSPSPPDVYRLPWDSEFFGVAIARVTPSRIAAADLASVTRWADEAGIDCVYFLADPADRESVSGAEGSGFSLVDVRVTLGRDVSRGAGAVDDPAVRPARPEDTLALREIARVSHRTTRFHRDARFDPERADEMYAVWIERAVAGELAQAVWVVDAGFGPLGYVTASREGACAAIGLIAVEPGSRGRGYGERLVRAALTWAGEQNAARMSVVTQGHEAAAIRFYERSGFTTQHVQLWYHYWPRRRSTAGSQ
jgi:dTDP-4-amino-4,6-dideoxy-D-galactose acyltransferase